MIEMSKMHYKLIWSLEDSQKEGKGKQLNTLAFSLYS